MIDKSLTRSAVTSYLNYRDAPAAIEWLCTVFAFSKHAIYEGPNSTILHSELTLGGGMIMVTSCADGNPFHRYMKQPDEIGGAETRGDNLIVDDADEVYDRVKAGGGEILFDIEDKPYGGRGFTCRDPGGHIWVVGTYDPWQPK
jgi:uncharacterized glyoxalase superfamily protein PhnB